MHSQPWKELTREEQDLYLVLLWNDGHIDEAIADFFGTTKGTIVGRRHRHHKSLASHERMNVKQVVDPERVRDLLDLHEMTEMEKAGVAAIAPVRGCEWPMSTGGTVTRPRLCGKPVLPGSRLCAEHDVQAKGMGRR